MLKPAFRASLLLLSEEDELCRLRTETLIPPMLNQIFDLRHFTLATDVSLIMFLRLVKYVSTVREFVVRNRDEYSWIVKYFEIRKEDQFIQNSVLYKNKALNKQTSKAPKSVVAQRAMDSNLFNARLALAGRPRSADDYDSDGDPDSIVNRNIRLHVSDTTYREARIVAYDEETNEHTVRFSDNGEQRSVSLFEKYFEMA